MKQRDYASEKEHKIKSTRKGLIILAIFIAIFITMIIRFAIRSGTNEGLFNLVPTGSEAYGVAKDYVNATMKFPDAEFNDDDFQYSKNSDSIYVVSSYFEVIKHGERVKTTFTAILKYNGGSTADDHNWTLVKLSEK